MYSVFFLASSFLTPDQPIPFRGGRIGHDAPPLQAYAICIRQSTP